MGRSSAKERRSPLTLYWRAGNVTLRLPPPAPRRISQIEKPISFKPSSGPSVKWISASASFPGGLPRSFGVILTVMMCFLRRLSPCIGTRGVRFLHRKRNRDAVLAGGREARRRDAVERACHAFFAKRAWRGRDAERRVGGPRRVADESGKGARRDQSSSAESNESGARQRALRQ